MSNQFIEVSTTCGVFVFESGTSDLGGWRLASNSFGRSHNIMEAVYIADIVGATGSEALEAKTRRNRYLDLFLIPQWRDWYRRKRA